jgi:putative flavoprotein involved in K+ transport
MPSFARDLDPGIVQLHSADYRNLSQLRPGGVLVVGAGNSGADIALEAARGGHRTWMSGRDVGHVPFRINSVAGRLVLVRLVLRGLFHRVLTVNTPMGRTLRRKMLSMGGPLIRVKPRDFDTAGVERVPRTAGVQNGRPILEDSRVLDVANVVWCTGFHPGFSWIDLPVFGDDGRPMQERGVAINEPGLYFVGLNAGRPRRLKIQRAAHHRQTTLPSSMALPMSAPAPAPMSVPIVFDDPGAMMLPRTPPATPPMIRPVVPSSRRQ